MLLCTHLHSQCTQAIHVTVYSLTLSVNSGNTCYCVLTYTISELRQYMLLCTHLHYKWTQAIHVTVYSLALSVHSGNTCYCVHTYTISALRQYMLLCTHLHSQYTQTIHVFSVLLFTIHSNNTCVLCPYTPNRNKGKGNGAGLAWESQSHCFADEFGITHAHSIGADTQHD